MRYLRPVLLGLLLIAWGGVLASSSQAARPDVETVIDPITGEPVTRIHVTVYDLPNPARTDAYARAAVAVMRQFIESFPNRFAERYRERYQSQPKRYGDHPWDRVEVRLHAFSGIRVEQVESDLLAIAGGMAPDILYVNFRKSDTYIQQGFLYPLDRPEDDYLTSIPEDELAWRVHEKIWPVIRRRGPGGAEHVWALPIGGALGRVLLYRKDRFDAAGLAYPTAAWTWDDLMQASRQLTDPARGFYGLGLTRGRHESHRWVTFLWSAGGEVMTYDADTDRWSIDFDSPAGVTALDMYTRLSAEPWIDADGRQRYGYAYKDTSDLSLKWERGEIAMQYSYVDGQLFSRINPETTGMVPVPLGPTGVRGAELNSRMVGLFAGIEHPAVRDAAWEYIRHLETHAAQALRTRIMVEGGMGPFMNPALLRRYGYDEVIRLSPPGWADTFDIAIASGKPEPYGRHSNVAYDLMSIPLQAAEQMALNRTLPESGPERYTILSNLLVEAADRARFEMLGTVPADELQKRRGTAAVVLAAIVLIFATVVRRIIRTFTPDVPAGHQPETPRWTRYAPAYLILLPALLTILIWQYVPLFRGSLMAFQDYRLMGNSSWVGIDHFGHILWNRDFWTSLWHATRYSIWVMALTFLPPVLLAIVLQEIPYGKIFFRTVFYLPAVISGLVVILLWKSFYDPSEQGALNAVLLWIPAWGFLLAGVLLLWTSFSFCRRLWFHQRRGRGLVLLGLGLLGCGTMIQLVWPMLTASELGWLQRLQSTLPEPYRWLQNPDTAMLACVLPLVWGGVGPGCLIYLAALKGVPDELYEAAEIDGAGFVDKILFVVFPMLKPLLIINFVGVFIGSWYGATDNILAMTGGAAGTEVIGLHIFYKAFVFLEFGPATAMAWMLGVLLIGFTVYQLQILSRLEFRTTGEDR
jgi:ABC-type sugar transport system permease subunit/ABC-type glycerol-3-phosphate transport system substrate-binding protein